MTEKSTLRARLKKVYGIGINDADYPVHRFSYKLDEAGNTVVDKREWTCPYYEVWYDMFRRCCSSWKRSDSYINYKDCSVCEEWLIFSNFKSWMETQDWEGKVLDKDLLILGNKIYSPNTCIFISNELNQFFKDRSNHRGKCSSVGVTITDGKYVSRCSDPFLKERVYLGFYDTEEEAHLAWKDYKHKLSLQWASMLESEGYDSRVVNALRERYSNEEVT